MYKYNTSKENLSVRNYNKELPTPISIKVYSFLLDIQVTLLVISEIRHLIMSNIIKRQSLRHFAEQLFSTQQPVHLRKIEDTVQLAAIH